MTDAPPTAEKSDTPRTDAALVRIKIEGEAFYGEPLVRADFARQLEREIAAPTQEILDLMLEVIEMRRSLLREENARKAAVKDAERYRWLKRQAEIVFFKDYQWVDAGDRRIHVKQINPVDLDATIDAAMEKNS